MGIKKIGLTYIEVAVVMSIISMLASIVLSNAAVSREVARDARRVADLEQFSNALTQYYITHRVFPCGDFWAEDPSDFGNTTKGIWVDGSRSCPFLDGIEYPQATINNCNSASLPICTDPITDPDCYEPHPNYSASGNGVCADPTSGTYKDGGYPIWSPKDPINNTAYYYTYYASMDRQKYILVARLEKNQSVMKNDGGFCDNLYEVGNGIRDLYIKSIRDITWPPGCN